jgi:hypothetical protein
MLASTMQFSNNQHSRKQTPFPENPTARPTSQQHITFHTEAVLMTHPDRAE